MKLSDVFRMYGSGGRPESSKPASHGRSFAIDAALAGACEVLSLPLPVSFFCLRLLLAFSCHVAPSAGLLFIKLTVLLALLSDTQACDVSSYPPSVESGQQCCKDKCRSVSR